MRSLAMLALVVLAGCGAAPAPASDAGPGADPPDPGFVLRELPAEPQRPGDPERGYHALVNNGYVSCGFPYSAYARVAGPGNPALRLPGREGRNAALPYLLTATRNSSGVEVVAANCLACHAGFLNGRLVVGLGNASADLTRDNAAQARLIRGFLTDPAEIAEWRRWSDRIGAIAPYTRPRTIGVNAADNLTAVLIARRDQRTLAWLEEPHLPLPPVEVVPVDVPPWWRMARKSTMFYNASGRGDHARIQMTASILCTDNVAEARQIDAYFPHIRAYIASLRPPPWPYALDAARAARGRQVFEATCARCHGTYGENARYPNLVVSLREVGTDDLLGRGAAQFGPAYIRWYNGSFFGERARIQPELGYVPPPLDGIWATAPFLHNGSVPTLAALLDSRTRPRYWTRNHADSSAYDPATLGWRFTTLTHGQRDEDDPDRRVTIYDTTLPGYGNGGHTYGDALAPDDRAALLEYLKTL